MTGSGYYVVTFEATGDAVRAEALLAPFGGTVIPVPQKISAGCGFAIKIPEIPRGLDEMIGSMRYGVYSVSGGGRDRVYERRA